MKRKYFKTPVPHIIIDDFFPSDQLNNIYKEIENLKDDYHEGVVQRNMEFMVDKDFKKNFNVWLDERYRGEREKSYILKSLKSEWFSEKNIKWLENHDNPFFSFIGETNDDRTLLSRYTDGDFYSWHKDGEGDPIILTLNIFISKPPYGFSGGDFILKRNNKTKVIPFKNNRAVLFPSRTLHSVSKVSIKNNTYINSRFTIQNWAALRKK